MLPLLMAVSGGAAVVLAVAVYVLTAPISEVVVAKLWLSGWLGKDSRKVLITVLRGFYAPVHWLAMRAPWPINSPFRWYYDLWLRQI